MILQSVLYGNSGLARRCGMMDSVVSLAGTDGLGCNEPDARSAFEPSPPSPLPLGEGSRGSGGVRESRSAFEDGAMSEAPEQIGDLLYIPNPNYPYPFPVERPPHFWMT